MRVVFATTDAKVASEVYYWAHSEPDQLRTARGTPHVYSQLLYLNDYLAHPPMGTPTISEADILALQNTSTWAIDPTTGERTAAWAAPTKVEWWSFGREYNPKAVYNSPFLHTVSLSPLEAGATYGYRVAGSERVFSFTMPPVSDAVDAAAFPMTLGVIADVGQTVVSQLNFGVLAALEPAAVLLAGDLAYADGWTPRWDSYGRMAEPLSSAVPVMTAGGNHEIGSGESWVSYNARYPMPAAASGSASNQWWSADIGPAHVVSLCSYAATAAGSPQREWLARDLAAVDRSRTPWLIVMMHAPWYSSNAKHWEESELSRLDLEPLLVGAGVDLVISGHVHAYERTLPMAKYALSDCGPVYVNVGDGGNREGAALPYRVPQPEWSAFREASFGVGSLKLANATHALFRWERTACEAPNTPDHTNFNATCESILASGFRDNSNNTARSDEVWLDRRARIGCARKTPSPSLRERRVRSES